MSSIFEGTFLNPPLERNESNKNVSIKIAQITNTYQNIESLQSDIKAVFKRLENQIDSPNPNFRFTNMFQNEIKMVLTKFMEKRGELRLFTFDFVEELVEGMENGGVRIFYDNLMFTNLKWLVKSRNKTYNTQRLKLCLDFLSSIVVRFEYLVENDRYRLSSEGFLFALQKILDCLNVLEGWLTGSNMMHKKLQNMRCEDNGFKRISDNNKFKPFGI